MPKSDIAEFRGRSIFSFMGTYLTAFYYSCISLHTQQQWMSVLHLCQNKLCKFCMARLFLIPCQYFKVLSTHNLISSTNTHEPTLANWLQFFHYMIDLDNLDKEIFHVTTNLFLCVSELWYHIQHKHLFSYLFFKITQGSKETMNTDSCSATNWEKQILFMMATFNSKLNQTPDTILNI